MVSDGFGPSFAEAMEGRWARSVRGPGSPLRPRFGWRRMASDRRGSIEFQVGSSALLRRRCYGGQAFGVVGVQQKKSATESCPGLKRFIFFLRFGPVWSGLLRFDRDH